MEEIKDRMKTHEITFKKTLSKEAKDIMLQLLRFEPGERLSLDKVMRHPFILKHIDEFENNRDSFKYIPPEPEWDNDLDIHPPLGLDPNDPQKAFEDEILNDPVKQNEYITSKLAEAKINPQDVEKVFFIRDEKNALKMRLQMKDRPQPKRGNSERKISNSFSQRFVPSVKKSDGSPKKYDEKTTTFENILRDNTDGEPEYSLGEQANEAKAFLKKFEETKIDDKLLKPDKGPAKNDQIRGNEPQKDSELEYNLFNDNMMGENENYSHEIMPSALGSPGRSDLAESVPSQKKEKRILSSSNQGTQFNFDNGMPPIQNPYSIGSSSSLQLGSQDLNFSQNDNRQTTSYGQGVAPLTLHTGQRREKSKSPDKGEQDMSPKKLQTAQFDSKEDQSKLIPIKSPDNLFKYDINQDYFAGQPMGGPFSSPGGLLNNLPMAGPGFQPRHLISNGPFERDGPVNQGLSMASKPLGYAEMGPGGTNFGSTNMPLNQNSINSAPKPQESGSSLANNWHVPSFNRQPEAAVIQSSPTIQGVEPSKHTLNQGTFNKTAEESNLNRGHSTTPLLNAKSPLNQPLRLNQRDHFQPIQAPVYSQVALPTIPNASTITAKLNHPLTAGHVQIQGYPNMQQGPIVGNSTEVRGSYEAHPERKQSANSNPDAIPTQMTTIRGPENTQPGAPLPIVISSNHLRNEKVTGFTSKTEPNRPDERGVRVPLEDLAKQDNLRQKSPTPQKKEPQNDNRNSSEIKSANFSKTTLQDNVKPFSGQPTISNQPFIESTSLPGQGHQTQESRQDSFKPQPQPNVEGQGQFDYRPHVGAIPQQGTSELLQQQGSKSNQSSPKKDEPQEKKASGNPLQTSLGFGSKTTSSLGYAYTFGDQKSEVMTRSVQENKLNTLQSRP